MRCLFLRKEVAKICRTLRIKRLESASLTVFVVYIKDLIQEQTKQEVAIFCHCICSVYITLLSSSKLILINIKKESKEKEEEIWFKE